jgi:predicted enzyme related to lactoylglutathione lyase
MGPLMGEGQPPSWTTYVSVDDADKTAARVTEAGGQVLMEAMDVMAAGRMAVFMDPTGAAFSIWQPGETIGAQLVNEPGTLCWNELATRDAGAAKTFYSHVFDWTWQPMAPGGPEYWMLEVAGRVSGGLMPMVGDMWPADMPSHWMTYFAVDDSAASATQVSELGGAVMVPPTDIPPGRFAVVNDPHGAVFSILKLNQADPAP